MFAKNPLDLLRGTAEKLHGERVCDAIRLAIIAELDAISTYIQLADQIDDRLASEVFRRVAEEEKEHLGEFMTLLYRCDPSLRKMMEKGAEEVMEAEREIQP